jgi:hypothetical protein
VLELKFASALISPIRIPPQFHRYLTRSPWVYLEMGEKIQSEWPAVCVCSVLIALVRRRTQTKDKGALIKQKELENRTQTNWPTRIIFIAVRGLFWERSPRENRRRHPTARFTIETKGLRGDWLTSHSCYVVSTRAGEFKVQIHSFDGEMLSPLAPLLAPSFLGCCEEIEKIQWERG